MFNEQQTPSQAQCASTLRAACAAGASSAYYNSTTHQQLTGDPTKLPNLDQDLATFLLQRGPYAYLGVSSLSNSGRAANRRTLTDKISAPQTHTLVPIATPYHIAVGLGRLRFYSPVPGHLSGGHWQTDGLLQRNGARQRRLFAAVDQGDREHGLQRLQGDGDADVGM